MTVWVHFVLQMEQCKCSLPKSFLWLASFFNQNHNRYWLILLYTEFGYDVKRKVGCDVVISYRNLWNVMKDKGISQYALIKQYHVSPAQITRLKRNESVSTHTIEMFCKILDCQVGDIMEYIPDDDQRCDYSRD